MKFWALCGLSLLLVGCGNGGGDNNTVATGPGGMSVDKNGAIHDNRGNTYTAPPSTVSEKDFPVPFYPNSQPDGGGSDFGDTKMPDGKRNVIANRTTTDPVDKVVAFYKDKLPGETEMSSPGGTMMSGKFPNGTTCSVVVTKEDRGTTFSISAVLAN